MTSNETEASENAIAPKCPQGRVVSSGLWLEERCEELPFQEQGPFVRLGDRRLLTVDDERHMLFSSDGGANWEPVPLFSEDDPFQIGPERALLRTSKGTVILAFSNMEEKANWNWDPDVADSPGAQLPTYAMRSLDDGKTWEPPQKLHDSWTGAIRDMIETQNAHVVFTSMMMLHDPGRHAVLTYSSPDDGATWRRSNILDLGGSGHHGGATEATLEQLNDGRLWKLIRTNWGVFWEAFSEDDGVSWRTIGPTRIDASSAPGMLKRLASGRLLLVWNRYFPEGEHEYPLSGGDNQWSEVPVSNHREELALAFSENDGATWSNPVVIARKPGEWLAYPHVFEAAPGEIWVTTMQGAVRAKFMEKDFVA